MFLMTWRAPETQAAHHTLELPLLFGCPERASKHPDAVRVSNHVVAAWTSFMRGEAACNGAPWPAYDATRRATLCVDIEPRVENAPLERERAAWQGLEAAWDDLAHGR
jgi:carboxylesterase type B